jgi:capsid protein
VDDANNYELNGLRAQAAFGLHLKTEEAPSTVLAGFNAETQDDAEAGDAKIINQASPTGAIDIPDGAFINVCPGDMKLLESNRPSGQYLDFVKHLESISSACMGTPYALLTGDMSQANYSSMRVAWLDAKAQIADWQDLLIEYLLRPCIAKWLMVANLTAQIDIGQRSPEEIADSVQFECAELGYVDPEKESAADLADILAGFSTWSQVLAKRGRNSVDQLAAIALEQQQARSADVNIPTIASTQQEEKPVKDEIESEDEEDDETEIQ